MLNFMVENGGTILIGVALAGIVAAIVIKLARDKKKGRTLGCDCGCGTCRYSENCHTK